MDYRNADSVNNQRKAHTYSALERVRKVVAEFVDGGVDGGFSVVVFQVLVYRLD